MELKDTTNNKFKNGDIVFVNDAWNTAEKCEITGFVEKESSAGKPVYIVHSLDTYGTFGVTEDCIFNTKENAISAYKTAFKIKVKSYCEQIRTIADFVRFPIDNCLCGEEYTDYAALEAYKIKAKEILNTTLKKGKWLIEDGEKNKYSFCYCSNCTHCKQNYVCFKKWLDSEDEQITLYNAEICR